MTMKTALVRGGSAIAAVGLFVGVLSACTPAPAPTPTPTSLFASDEEAFEAAEETYRAYVDAVNASDLSDPDSFEKALALVTGEALQAERESLSQYQAAELSRRGTTTFDSFAPLAVDGNVVTANLCVDVSEVFLYFPDGTPAQPKDRLLRDARKVKFVPGPSKTGLVIASNYSPEGDFSC